jgi:hypothetical protein
MSKPEYYFDASANKESACRRRLFLIIVAGYREKEQSPSLSYGSACHRYVETLRKTKDHQQGIIDACKYYAPYSSQWNDKEWRTLSHLMQSCGAYKNFYDSDRDLQSVSLPIDGVETVMVEQKFKLKIFENDFFILYLSGTIDEIGLYQKHKFVIIDRKTSSYYFKIDETLKMYQQSSQMLFYKYIAELSLNLKNLEVLIEGIFINSKEKTKIVRTPEPFEYEPWRMKFFKDQLNETIKNLIVDLTDYHMRFYGQDITDKEIFPMNFLACDSSRYDKDKIGACKFFNICANSDSGIREHMIKRDFIVKQYNPMMFGKDE